MALSASALSCRFSNIPLGHILSKQSATAGHGRPTQSATAQLFSTDRRRHPVKVLQANKNQYLPSHHFSNSASSSQTRVVSLGDLSDIRKLSLQKHIAGARRNESKRGLQNRAGRTDQVQETSAVPDGLAVQNGAASEVLVGEDAGVFDVTAQKTSSWVNFTIVLVVVLTILYVIWIDPTTGFGGKYIDVLEGAVGGSHEATIIALLSIFALVHSGGAALRASAEKLIGERAYRVLFAGLSLPLAVSAVVYFINHRYDETQLWQLRTVPGAHELVWAVSFISFFFLYPSTFNLLEVAAVDKPQVHMWETGIMRITRHPQMTGQLLWCLAHTLWIGNSFTLVTSIGLCAHHLFGVWHGDRRLEAKYGDAFQAVKARTSIVPFQAILEGRQKLPQGWYKEFLRLPYYVIVGVTLGAYFSHPLMQQGSFWLHW